MSTEHGHQNKKNILNEKIPRWREITAGLVAATALFQAASPSSGSEIPEPTPTPSVTATPLETTPTPEPTETTPVPETVVVTTNSKLEVRTANVTGKHMDGYTGNGYNKRPFYGTWAERRSTLVKDISAGHPDILGLQEVDSGSQSDYVKAALRNRGYETKAGTNLRPIYWDKDRFDLIKGGTFSLRDTDGRRASYAILNDTMGDSDLTTNQRLLVLNAHLKSTLNSAGNRDRVRSVKTLASEANTLSSGGKIPTFITGDFNSDIYGDPYDTLKLIRNSQGIRPVEAHTQTTNRVNYKYNTANMYLKYRSNGTTSAQRGHTVIDQGWYYKTTKDTDGSIVNVRTDKVYNDIPTVIQTKRHGAVRSSDHNAQTFYYNLETKKSVIQ
jgi:endonuclease/exonuclease/phosphatase family metal-dependent hydrolase